VNALTGEGDSDLLQKYMEQTEIIRLVETEQQIERLLVASAMAGIPELALISLLRDYAELIEQTGYVPRTWRD